MKQFAEHVWVSDVFSHYLFTHHCVYRFCRISDYLILDNTEVNGLKQKQHNHYSSVVTGKMRLIKRIWAKTVTKQLGSGSKSCTH